MTLDNEYANSAHIPDGESYYARWDAAAATFRAAHPLGEVDVPYGPAARQTYDMFHPERSAKGTVIFLHGGYWQAGSPAMFSHLAQGAVAAGYACAMPSYTLAPDARIAQITREVGDAIDAIARRTSGPLYLVGHSAGAHLVARMVCAATQADWHVRVVRVMPISPISNLAPLMETSMNETLLIDSAEAQAESPVFHDRHSIPVTLWVGGAERPAFLDQAQWLADRWDCDHVIDAGRHHFDVIEGLLDPASPMLQTLFK